MSRQRTSDLGCQALRLPPRSVDRLRVLVHDLRITGSNANTGTVIRGLCLFALNVLQGRAGQSVAAAFRVAASDPTARGIYRGLKMLRSLRNLDDDDEPPTVRMASAGRRTGSRSPRVSPRQNEDLRVQALRLPLQARMQIQALTRELNAAGSTLTTSGVSRGLCALAMHLADNDMDNDVARIVRHVMVDPTENGASLTAELLRVHLGTPPELSELDAPDTDPMPALFPETYAA